MFVAYTFYLITRKKNNWGPLPLFYNITNFIILEDSGPYGPWTSSTCGGPAGDPSGPQKVLVKKILGPKKFWVKKNFWSKKFLGQKKIGWKFFLGQNNFWSILGQKNFGSKNFGPPPPPIFFDRPPPQKNFNAHSPKKKRFFLFLKWPSYSRLKSR